MRDTGCAGKDGLLLAFAEGADFQHGQSEGDEQGDQSGIAQIGITLCHHGLQTELSDAESDQGEDQGEDGVAAQMTLGTCGIVGYTALNGVA